jgi:hypothetical protein
MPTLTDASVVCCTNACTACVDAPQRLPAGIWHVIDSD